MKRSTLVLGLLAILLSTAFGQRGVLQTKIPFEFVAGSHTLPAGDYNFSATDRFVQIKNVDTGKTVSVAYITRIAADRTATGKARVSFDVQEGKHFIEALWPGQDGDGYLVHSVKGKHTHETVRSQ
jgi:hypothetical protein